MLESSISSSIKKEILTPCTKPSPSIYQSLSDHVDVQLVEATYGSHNHNRPEAQTGNGRYAREAAGEDAMPSNLHFRLQFGSREVNLRVRKSVPDLNKDGKKDVIDFPVFVIEDGLIKRKRLLHQPVGASQQQI